MEFAEFISIPKLDNVILHGPFHEPVEGTLCITGHHLILSSRKEGIQELWILHQSIDNIEKKQFSNSNSSNFVGGSITIKCKDLRIIQLEINHESFSHIFTSIERLSNIANIALLYPFFYRPMYNILEDGHTMFKTEVEFTKLLASDEWRVTDINRDYEICPTYGKVLIVPKSIDDETIYESAKFREMGRFPVISYRHENGGTILLRSSQPTPGPNNRRCRSDERLLNAILGLNKRGYILDTRSMNLAAQCKAKGGGFELEINYPQWRRIHKPLDKLTNGSSALLDSFTKLVEACNDTNCSSDKWLSRLDASGWLGYVLSALNAACVVAQCLDQENVSVLVHGSTGLDATLLVTSLTQVVLNPDCRTVRGFQALIEREWLQAGHPFKTRHSHSCYSTAQSGRTKNNQPIFLLFLDCVQQLHYQFPCSFEFTTHFLILLFEHSYFSQFGTFLGNNEQERNNLKTNKTTTSLWSYINRPDILTSILNPMYEPNPTPIWPSVAPISLTVWSELYLRWVIDQTSIKASLNKIQTIRQHDKDLRTQVIKLRKQLIDLQKEYDTLNESNNILST